MAKASHKDEDGPRQPYGFVLVLRGIARAAILLDSNPAALRVLCVVAEYMDQEARCRVSQGTIAARLNMSRQAVNRHLRLLDNMEILVHGAVKDGVTHNYVLDTDGLEYEREGQGRVDARLAAKRNSKRHIEITYRISRQSDAKPQGGNEGGVNAVSSEALSSNQAKEFRTTVATQDQHPPATAHAIGARVSHNKFGAGTIASVRSDTSVGVLFDCDPTHEKGVLISFLQRLPATSDVARGAA